MVSGRVPSFVVRGLPWLAAAILPFSLMIYLAQLYLHGDAGAKVFASYWASGRQLAEGLDPYAFHPGVWVFRTKGGDIVRDINLNPPMFLPFCRLISLIPLQAAAAAWGVALCAGFAAAIGWLNRRVQPHWAKAAWAFLFLPVWDSIIIGQNYIVLLLLALAAWAALRASNHVLAAVALGLLVALKPNFALLMPILFLARHYRLALLTGVAATLFTALPMMVYGPQIYRDWLLALSQDNHWIFTTTVSLPSYFQRLGLKEIGAATAVLVLAGACALAWIRRPNAQWATMLGLLTGILASPLAWFHYLLVLLPFLVSMKWNTQIALGAAAFVVLQPTIVLYAMGKGLPVLATLGGAMLFATLLLGWGIVRQMLEAPSADEARRADA